LIARRRPPLVLAAAVIAAGATIAAVGSGVIRLPAAADPTASTSPSASPVALASPSASAPPVHPTTPATPAPPLDLHPVRPLDTPRLRERLQAALDAGRADLAAPGMVASIVFPDGHQWTGVSGVADLATKRPLEPNTPFAIASVSKTFLAAEILLLADEGRLGLDDPAVRLLPPALLVGKVALDPAISVRMLLDHTSGLGDFLISPALDKAVLADPAAVWTPEQALTYAGPVVGKPGLGYHYANTNYVLLGMIAEDLTGRTLAEEFRSRFFEPLHLASATYQGVEPPVAELPTAYRYSSVRLDARPLDITDGTDVRPFTAITTAAGAAGSVAASARDLALWARALYGGRVLSEDALELMTTGAAATSQLKPAYPYGLGVQVFLIDGHITYGHSGRLVGARSTMRYFPLEDLSIAIVTNESRFDPNPVLVDLFRIVAPTGPGSLPVE
jgi:D-alanyl-D-alanine carboxypeptidase